MIRLPYLQHILATVYFSFSIWIVLYVCFPKKLHKVHQVAKDLLLPAGVLLVFELFYIHLVQPEFDFSVISLSLLYFFTDIKIISTLLGVVVFVLFPVYYFVKGDGDTKWFNILYLIILWLLYQDVHVLRIISLPFAYNEYLPRLKEVVTDWLVYLAIFSVLVAVWYFIKGFIKKALNDSRSKQVLIDDINQE